MTIAVGIQKMTTYKMYRCNLCGDYLAPTDSTPKPGYGIYFENVVGNYLVFKEVPETEKHICHECAKGIHKELEKIMHVKE